MQMIEVEPLIKIAERAYPEVGLLCPSKIDDEQGAFKPLGPECVPADLTICYAEAFVELVREEYPALKSADIDAFRDFSDNMSLDELRAYFNSKLVPVAANAS
jgi:hypothetical protein